MTIIQARNLAHENLGHVITVRSGETSITGLLAEVTHEADLIEEPPRMFDASNAATYAIGRSKTVVIIVPHLRLELAPNGEVKVAE